MQQAHNKLQGFLSALCLVLVLTAYFAQHKEVRHDGT
jgi:hypothetical protein